LFFSNLPWGGGGRGGGGGGGGGGAPPPARTGINNWGPRYDPTAVQRSHKNTINLHAQSITALNIFQARFF
jgi:hypothetical protein